MEETDFDPADFPPPERSEPAKLYLISPQEVGGDFPQRLRSAVEGGGVAAFQLRVKDVGEHDLARLAEPLQRTCADHDVAFIVNDSIALAKRLGADGVHLGQQDGDVREARALLGPAAQIGRTCHDSRHLAMEAGEAGGGGNEPDLSAHRLQDQDGVRGATAVVFLVGQLHGVRPIAGGAAVADQPQRLPGDFGALVMGAVVPSSLAGEPVLRQEAPAQRQRGVRDSSAAVAATPAVEERSTDVPSRSGSAPTAENASSSCSVSPMATFS